MILVTNFKTYENATGKKALYLAKVHENVAKRTKVKFFLAPQFTDIYMIAKRIGLPVIAQHVDAYLQGKNTGYILPESIKRGGAIGTLLNHAEHRISYDNLVKAIKRCHKLNLKTIVCTANLNEVKKLKALKPYAIAYEEPKLIGTGISITKVRKAGLKKFVKIIKNTSVIPLCGAGISNKQDVQEAVSLGLKGVLVSSSLTKARNPKKILTDLVRGFKL